MRATACLRFETPFQNKAGLDDRQKVLEGWGVKVTERFEEAVADCDAIVVAINDPAYHLEYFRKCSDLGKPIFLDKPLADTIGHGREIAAIIASKGLSVMSCSSLRYVSALVEACNAIPTPAQMSSFGPLGKAPSGSSIVWYGVHAFEMLERAMGRGAASVTVVNDRTGVVCVVDYGDGRRGVVELSEGNYSYGGTIRGGGKAVAFVADMSVAYAPQLREIEAFFRTGKASLTFDDTVEVMAMLDAAQQAASTGKTVLIQK
jgi:predicted dehydrogenase